MRLQHTKITVCMKVHTDGGFLGILVVNSFRDIHNNLPSLIAHIDSFEHYDRSFQKILVLRTLFQKAMTCVEHLFSRNENEHEFVNIFMDIHKAFLSDV